MTNKRSNTYLPEYAHQAYRLCLVGITTDKQLSNFLEASEKSIKDWKRDYPEFSEAIAVGRQIIGDDGREGPIFINLAGGYPASVSAAKEYLVAIEGDKHG